MERKYRKEYRNLDWIRADDSTDETLKGLIDTLQKKYKEYKTLYPDCDLVVEDEYEVSGFGIYAISYFKNEDEYNAYQIEQNSKRQKKLEDNERKLYEQLKAKFES